MLTFFLSMCSSVTSENLVQSKLTVKENIILRRFISSKYFAFKDIKSFALPFLPIECNYQKAFIVWYNVYIVITRLMN